MDRLLSRVPALSDRLFPMPAEEAGVSPEAAAERYEETLRRVLENGPAALPRPVFGGSPGEEDLSDGQDEAACPDRDEPAEAGGRPVGIERGSDDLEDAGVPERPGARRNRGADEFAGVSEVLNRNICPYADFRFSVYRRDAAPGECFGVIELLCDDQDLSQTQVARIIASLRREIRGRRSVRIRQFVDRKPVHDRRQAAHQKPVERRQGERRSARRGTLVYRVESAAGEPSVRVNRPTLASAVVETVVQH